MSTDDKYQIYPVPDNHQNQKVEINVYTIPPVQSSAPAINGVQTKPIIGASYSGEEVVAKTQSMSLRYIV